MKTTKLFFPLLLSLLFSTLGCSSQSSKQYIAIVSAMDVEIDLLLEKAQIQETKTIGKATFHVGKLEGKDVVISHSGIGKINASSAMTSAINSFDLSKVIFTGVAGGVKDEENVLDQVVGTKVIEHDYGYRDNDGFLWCGGDPGKHEPGEVYECDKALVDLAYSCALATLKDQQVFKGTIASGDQFVASSDYVAYLDKEFDAYACEMEGAAVAKVCANFAKPFLIMRTLSDKADGAARESYVDFMDEAGDQSSSIVLRMLQSL